MSGKGCRPANAWPQERTDHLCDLVAQGFGFTAVSARMGMSRNAVLGRFNRIRKSYGWQGE